MCGTLRATDAGKKAVLMGWVNKRRDHGSLLFVDLRDRTGVAQVVFNADRSVAIHEKAGSLRNVNTPEQYRAVPGDDLPEGQARDLDAWWASLERVKSATPDRVHFCHHTDVLGPHR